MIKKENLFFTLILGFAAHAQVTQAVGVNTSTPSATLDVVSFGKTIDTKALKISDANSNELMNVRDDGNVGIGVTAPVTKLHVKAVDSKVDPIRVEGLQPSTNGLDLPLVVDADGNIKTAITYSSYFAGYIATDFVYDNDNVTLYKITVDKEIFDFAKEYDTNTGYFTPKADGAFIYEIQVTFKSMYYVTGNYGEPNGAAGNRVVIGFVDANAKKWIGRANIEACRDGRSYVAKGIVSLKKGVNYYFGIAGPTSPPPPPGSDPYKSTIIAEPISGTYGTYFSIQRIQ